MCFSRHDVGAGDGSGGGMRGRVTVPVLLSAAAVALTVRSLPRRNSSCVTSCARARRMA